MKKLFICLSAVFLLIGFFNTKALAEEQLVPKRLSSIGDSITVGMNAELPLENHYASWANGYYGFWQWLFGLTNVNSHNQRITAEFGRRGRRNYMEAESGATSADFFEQSQRAVGHQAFYVTVLLGNNDVCSDDLPLHRVKFVKNMWAGLSVLETGLTPGATVYVVGIPDITELWDAIKDKKALGIINCQDIWALNPLDLFPSTCMDLLNEAPDVIQGYIIQYNTILKNLVDIFNADSPNYYFYTEAVFLNGVSENEVSDIDCYHPSAEGQAVLSDITWNAPDGPRFFDW